MYLTNKWDFLCCQIETGCLIISQYLNLYHLHLTVLLSVVIILVKLSLKLYDLNNKLSRFCLLFIRKFVQFVRWECLQFIKRILRNRNYIIIQKYSDQYVGSVCIFCTLHIFIRLLLTKSFLYFMTVLEPFHWYATWLKMCLFILGYFPFIRVFCCLSNSLHSFGCHVHYYYVTLFFVDWYLQAEPDLSLQNTWGRVYVGVAPEFLLTFPLIFRCWAMHFYGGSDGNNSGKV